MRPAGKRRTGLEPSTSNVPSREEVHSLQHARAFWSRVKQQPIPSNNTTSLLDGRDPWMKAKSAKRLGHRDPRHAVISDRADGPETTAIPLRTLARGQTQ